MKSVLLSIKPYYVFLIIAHKMGWDIPQEKTIEVRKDFPKDIEWNKVVHIYCSKDVKSFNLIPAQYQPLMREFVGKVIGDFVCEKVEEFHEWQLSPQGKFQEEEQHDLDVFLRESCLTITEVVEYRKNLPYYKPLYGWHISELKIYDKPKPLTSLYKPCPIEWKNCPSCEFYSTNTGCCMNNVDRPPQSYMYVEEL